MLSLDSLEMSFSSPRGKQRVLISQFLGDGFVQSLPVYASYV